MNPLVGGANEEERIVAVQPRGEKTMRVYTRGVEGRVTAGDRPFYPFFFLTSPDELAGFPAKHWIKELGGTNPLRWICAFTSWTEMWDAVHYMLERYAERTREPVQSFAELPFLHLRPDPVAQFLLQTGMTLFKGMAFGEVERLQLDIETYAAHGARFGSARRPGDRITLIALAGNGGWEHLIDGRALSEKAMLAELVRTIRERDPDVIEGHNIYNFDLPYILARCELLGVEPAFGRDGALPRSFDARMSFAERGIEVSAHEIPGRHIVDTWLLLQAWDVAHRSLESYGLKYAARYFGLAAPGRTYIPGERISWTWDHEPGLLVRYALDDVRETRGLSDLLSPTAFCQAQMLPSSYGAVARMGSAAKIESLLVREYLRRKESLPLPEPPAEIAGGYADLYYSGLTGPVVHVDVESLYPSIMLTRGIGPRREPLGAFSELLATLTRLRLDAKRAMQAAPPGSPEAARHDAMQSSLKTLINSFYGYLGYGRGLFNDMAAAEEVTRAGQRILRLLIESIRALGGTVVEVDTDGIFFIPPPGTAGEEEERAFVARAAGVLPRGITLAVGGRYANMLSYKTKNYALLGYDGTMRVRGSSLTSRSIERFGRTFVERALRALLERDIAGLHAAYTETRRAIAGRTMAIAEMVKSETLKETQETYEADVAAGRRNRAASYEVAIAAGLEWRTGDRVSYYITGNDAGVRGFENCRLGEEWDPERRDENAPWYLRRLDEFARKFEPFFTPRDFRAVFSDDDLFAFDAAGIAPLAGPVTPAGERPDPKIWLGEEAE